MILHFHSDRFLNDVHVDEQHKNREPFKTYTTTIIIELDHPHKSMLLVSLFQTA